DEPSAAAGVAWSARKRPCRPAFPMINIETLHDIKDRFDEVTRLMAEPDVATDPEQMRRLGREHAALKDVVQRIEHYEALLAERQGLRTLLRETQDGELVDLARAELDDLEARL